MPAVRVCQIDGNGTGVSSQACQPATFGCREKLAHLRHEVCYNFCQPRLFIKRELLLPHHVLTNNKSLRHIFWCPSKGVGFTLKLWHICGLWLMTKQDIAPISVWEVSRMKSPLISSQSVVCSVGGACPIADWTLPF